MFAKARTAMRVVWSDINQRFRSNLTIVNSTTYRPAKEEDLPAILKIAQEDDDSSGHLRLYSPAVMKFLFRISRDNPNGFIVAERENKVIGVIVAHVVGPDLCVGGINTVAKKYRGKGIGRVLSNHINHFVGKRNFAIGAYGDEQTLQIHAKHGFNTVGYKTLEFGGKLDRDALQSQDTDIKLHGLSDIEMSKLIKYDASIVSRGSTNLVDAFLSLDGVISVVAVKRGEVVGFGAMDTTHEQANHISPLYADDMDVAKRILLHLTYLGGERNSFLTAPTNNKIFLSFLEKTCPEYKATFPCACVVLFSKRLVDVPEGKIYAVSNYVVYVC